MKKTTVIKNIFILSLTLMVTFISSPYGLAAEDLFPGTAADSSGAAALPLEALPGEPAGDTARLDVERMPDGKFFLDFKEAPLINVLNVIASLSGINFVAGKELSKRQVNMTLDSVSLEDALEAIALGCNISYEYLPGRNIYLFRGTTDDDGMPVLMTKVFKFYYIRVTKPKDIEAESTSSGSGSQLTTLKEQKKTDLEAESIFKTVTKMLSKRGKVSVDERSNSLVVTDIETRIKMIESAIKELDQPLKQVLINVFLIETYEDLDRQLGIRWGDATGTFGTIYGGTENTSFPFMTKSGSSGSDLGNWYTMLTNQLNPAVNTAPGTGPNASTATSGRRDFSAFQIQLKAMEDAQKIKTLAKPKILVLDNHPALIKIATNAAISQNTVVTGGGAGTSMESIERSEIGTILRVTPLISSDNKITLTVEPTFATVARSTITVSATETGDPTIRQARTTLMINDGQTIALGGLLFSDQSKDVRKVPFFGNIPGIGKAFFTTNTSYIKDRELILFLTPFIIGDPAVLETVKVPDHRLRFDDETDPFWKVKSKEWFKNVKQPADKAIDYERYFDVRKRLMDATLDTLDQKAAK